MTAMAFERSSGSKATLTTSRLPPNAEETCSAVLPAGMPEMSSSFGAVMGCSPTALEAAEAVSKVTTAPLLPLSITSTHDNTLPNFEQIFFTPWTSPSRGIIANTRVFSKHRPLFAHLRASAVDLKRTRNCPRPLGSTRFTRPNCPSKASFNAAEVVERGAFEMVTSRSLLSSAPSLRGKASSISSSTSWSSLATFSIQANALVL
mmetsp:Transcript_3172/g.7718  ORF Transcript_3172/g.7718 Transcript_3172/m.7718 type:complete len:205 (+) Transcript_3172:412-1026(+)